MNNFIDRHISHFNVLVWMWQISRNNEGEPFRNIKLKTTRKEKKLLFQMEAEDVYL